MGNPMDYPVYFDKLLLNASQVTNPSIDPLREPMETRVFLGAKPGRIERDGEGRLVDNRPPHLTLSMPVMFSAMSYGSVSYNVDVYKRQVYSARRTVAISRSSGTLLMTTSSLTLGSRVVSTSAPR